MNVFDFYYDLPEELIAQTPADKRDHSRLLTLKGGNIEHKIFSDIYDMINPGDCLVLNDSKVLPARLYGNKLHDKKIHGDSATIEFLLLHMNDDGTWNVILRPGRKAPIGSKFGFGENNELTAEIISIGDGGTRTVKFRHTGYFFDLLDRIGSMPLPPYITQKLDDKNRYQTVYAKNIGSAAAPTAGLHFTDDLLKQLGEKGVNIAYLTLHIGLGTFRPVKVKTVEDHHMHTEFYTISKATADIVNQTKSQGKKIICVGTTSCRTLESAADENGLLKACEGNTDIFIYPGYKFKLCQSLITNFHLPESTLLMLVSALCGRENIMKAYNEAIREKYRFFSFGDAMFIN